MTDAFDLNIAQIVNAPDVRSWPATATITSLQFGNGQTRVEFTKRHGPDRWPDVTPQGWDGPIQFTLWLFRQLQGQWVGSGFIEFWNDRDASGSPSDPDVPSLYAKNWYYADRWSPLYSSGPIATGELIGFMVTSGDARDSKGPFGPSERSNIVTVAASDNASYAWSADAPPINTPPVLPTHPAPIPDPPQTYDPAPLIARIVALETRVSALENRPAQSVVWPDYIGTVSYPFFGSRTIRSKPEVK